ncbi:hypothetical protein ScPMuIL_007033 [Solemya velum]
MDFDLRKKIEEWEKMRKMAEKRIAFKQASLASWGKTNQAIKRSLTTTFRMLKARGYDPTKWEKDLEMVESAIPTQDVAPREGTKQIDWLKFGFLKYPWRCNAGIKLDTTLVNAKLTALECEIDNFRQLQERNEILYGVLQSLKSKAWGAYLQIRENEKTSKPQKAV